MYYTLASALVKSLCNSDADAGVYWLARLIEGGADPVFIARRLCILASEDVGLADPQAIVQAAAAAQIVQLIGLPEGCTRSRRRRSTWPAPRSRIP